MILSEGRFNGNRTSARQPANRGSLLRLISYTRRVWYLLVAVLVCLIMDSLLELAVPWVMGFMLLDRIIRQGDLSELPLVIMMLGGIFLGQKLFSFLEAYYQELANQHIVHELRCDFYEHIERLPLRFFERGRTGELLSRITGDVDTLEGLLSTLAKNVASQLIMFIGTLSFLFAVNSKLTMFVLPTIPALALSVFFVKRTIKRYSRRVRDLIGEISGLVGETFLGIRVVKASC